MKARKQLALLLVFVMILTLLGGCSKKDETAKTDTGARTGSSVSTDQKEENSASAEDAGETGTHLATPSWKTDTSPITLEWFIGYDWASFTFDPENNAFDKWLQEETGITISYSYGDQEKLNMLIATDSLPDIVTYNMVSPERISMENGGMLLPLDDLRDQYAPDFRVVPAMMDWYRNKDGHWYAYSSYFYDVEDTEARGGYLSSHNMLFARRDIMEQLGIQPEDLHTKDGLVDALKKVKDAHIVYNGVEVEPIHAAGGSTTLFLAEQFGLNREDADGQLLNTVRQPEYLEALLFQNRLWREGLLSDEEFTQDNTLRKQKVTSGGYFAGLVQAEMEGMEQLYHSDNNALMMSVGLIQGDSGKEPIISPSATGGWTGTMITKNCKNPERAAQLFAFMSQPDVAISYYLGGVGSYEMVDGKAYITEEAAAERDKDPDAFNARTRSGVQEYLLDYVDVILASPEDDLDEYWQNQFNGRRTYQDGHYYDDKIFSDVAPEGGTDLAAISAQIDEYWGQQVAQIIMAPTAEQAESLYEEGIAQMDEMGMKDLDAYRNERFQENKKRMGVEFAWPRNK